jgi:hypothetical protein
MEAGAGIGGGRRTKTWLGSRSQEELRGRTAALLVVLVLVGAVGAGCGSGVRDASDPRDLAQGVKKAPLKFKVTPSKRRYAVGEQVDLRLALRLASRARSGVSVSTYANGTVHVRSVKRTRRGKRRPIRPHRSVMDFEEDPLLVQVESLTTIAPGEKATIPYDVELDGTAGVVLTDVRLRRSQEHVALVYRLTGPGLYTLRLSYRYAGRSGGKANVFRGRLLSNRVRFRVVP